MQKLAITWLIILVCGIFIGTGARLSLILTQPLEKLIQLCVSDDAFYYYVVAHNWLLGYGSTFDREHFTNGYHPLWMLCLMVVFKLFGGGTGLAIKFTLGLAALFQLLTACLIFLLARNIWKVSSPAIVASLIFFLSPPVIWEGFNGLETSLAVLTLYVFYSIVLNIWQYQKLTTGWAVVAGISAASVFLARTDQIFYLLPVWLYIYIMGNFSTRLWLFKTCAVALLVVLPWLIWNVIHTGTIIQASAIAYPLIIIHHAEDTGYTDFWSRIPFGFIALRQAIFSKIPNLLLEARVFWVGFLLWLILSIFFPRTSQNTPQSLRLKPFTLLLFPLIGLGCLIIIHCFLRLYPRHWYFAGFMPLGALILGNLYSRLSYLFRHNLIVALIFIIFLFLGFYPRLKVCLAGYYNNQAYHYAEALWTNKHLQPGNRIGSFNAGILAYYSHCKVINLDGKANNEVLSALKNRTLWSYIKACSLSYLIDNEWTITTDYATVMDVPGYPNSVLKKIADIYCNISYPAKYAVFKIINDKNSPAEHQ
ncbi:MAG: hypothetical protein N2246_07575 [Candidatus Sumerlaeia bacterium]|nr:hypothetical protein [Candidatus Sumerlaeia bacterium]